MIINEPIKALSWKEPYGTLMLQPFNKIETRIWDAKYRGLVLICTSKEPYSELSVHSISGEQQVKRIKQCLVISPPRLYGRAIAIGRLVDSRPMQKQDEQQAFVEYREPWEETVYRKKGKKVLRRELFAHIYEDVRRIKPFPWKGALGFRPVSQDIIDQIELI